MLKNRNGDTRTDSTDSGPEHPLQLRGDSTLAETVLENAATEHLLAAAAVLLPVAANTRHERTIDATATGTGTGSATETMTTDAAREAPMTAIETGTGTGT